MKHFEILLKPVEIGAFIYLSSQFTPKAILISDNVLLMDI